MQTEPDIVLSGDCLPLGSGKYVHYNTKSIRLIASGKKVKTIKMINIKKVAVYVGSSCFVVVVAKTE